MGYVTDFCLTNSMKKFIKEGYKKYGIYFPADLWAFFIIVIMIIIGFIFFS